MSDFRVIIAGGRDFNDYDLLEDFCDQCLASKERAQVVTISGKLAGADTLGERYARNRGFRTVYVKADPEKHGAMCQGIFGRNKEMVGQADAAIIFWNGTSNDMWNLRQECRNAGIPFRVKKYQP